MRRRIAKKRVEWQLAVIRYTQRLYRGHRVRLQLLYTNEQLRDNGYGKEELVRKIRDLDMNARIPGNGDMLGNLGLNPIRSRVFAPLRTAANAHYQLTPMMAKNWSRFLKMHSHLKLQYPDQFEELNNSPSIRDLTSFREICSHCE